jgi:hypothetical protein
MDFPTGRLLFPANASISANQTGLDLKTTAEALG